MTSIPDWLRKEVEEYDLTDIQPPKTVVDIGANIGAFCVRVSKLWPEAAITAYEPVLGNFIALKGNTEKMNVKLVNSAVMSDENKRLTIFISSMHTKHSFVRGTKEPWKRTEDVSVKSASKIGTYELVKVDTEGCEVQILKEMDLSGTKNVLCEYHSSLDMDKLVSLLGEKGFTMATNNRAKNGMGTLRFKANEQNDKK